MALILDHWLMGTLSHLLSCSAVLLTAYSSAQSVEVLHEFGDEGDGASPFWSGLMIDHGVAYGVTSNGGSDGYGAVYKLNLDGSGYSVLYSFGGGADGAFPQTTLTLAGGALYGTTSRGGIGDIFNGGGTVFRMNLDGTGFAVLHSFTYDEGGRTQTALTVNEDTIFGATYGNSGFGSPTFGGAIFKMKTDGTDYSALHAFNTSTDGAHPQGALTLSGNVLFGTTSQSGPGNGGTIFKMGVDGSGFAVLFFFGGAENSFDPRGTLVLKDNVLYGTNYRGGLSNDGFGTVFSLNTDGTNFHRLHAFLERAEERNPWAGLTLAGTTLYGTTSAGGSDHGAVFQVNTDGSDYRVLDSFAGDDGSIPVGELVLDGTALYGNTWHGGRNDAGVIFSLAVPEPSAGLLLVVAGSCSFCSRRRTPGRNGA